MIDEMIEDAVNIFSNVYLPSRNDEENGNKDFIKLKSLNSIKYDYLSSPKAMFMSNPNINSWSKAKVRRKRIIDDTDIALNLKPNLFSYREIQEDRLRLDEYFLRQKTKYNNSIRIKSSIKANGRSKRIQNECK